MDLLTQVRAQVQGKKALFVSNRNDPDLQRLLESELGLKLDWCEGSARRIDALCHSIRNGRYQLVLCATGFQRHTTDQQLAPAARGARIPYVRVNKGRLLACVTALARSLGIRP